MKTIAITGATGYIGGRLTPLLLDSGYRVRCLVRTPRKLRDRHWSGHPNLEVCAVDLNNEGDLAAGLAGCEAAFYLVHSMMSAGDGYAKQDNDLALHFARAATQAGVARILYLGGLGETGPDLSEHLASRREVEHVLGSTGVPVTVLRAAMIIGSGSASFEILRYLVERLPVMVTPRWVSTPCQPIAVRNVLEYLVRALETPETTGQVFDIGGTEILPYREIMQIMASELGLKHRGIVVLPFLTPRLSSYWIHLVTPLSHQIAKPLAEGLRNPVVCRDQRILTLIPQHLLTVRESIHAALARVAGHEVPTNWSMAGRLPGDPDWAGGTLFRDARTIPVKAPASAAFRAVCQVGGEHGWYAADWMWRIRGWLDLLVGGPGLRRGRRHPEELCYGEALDFWRVSGIAKDQLLQLRAEMKLPGEALLEFRIVPTADDRCTLEQVALFKPKGLLGLAYWYSVLPFHHFVFDGMLRGIRAEAEKLAGQARA